MAGQDSCLAPFIGPKGCMWPPPSELMALERGAAICEGRGPPDFREFGSILLLPIPVHLRHLVTEEMQFHMKIHSLTVEKMLEFKAWQEANNQASASASADQHSSSSSSSTAANNAATSADGPSAAIASRRVGGPQCRRRKRVVKIRKIQRHQR